MAKQTSRMYGIKVKEKVNYYEYDDIKLSFDNGIWTVTSLYDGVWFNGVNYHKDEIIVMFGEGNTVNYKIMAQYTDEVPYINYMYDVIGNAAESIEYGNKDVHYRILTQDQTSFKIRVYEYENNIIKAEKDVTPEKILQYREKYQKKYPVFNMLFDWHGMNPESGYPQMSFQCISNSSYIKVNEQQKDINENIAIWQGASFIDLKVVDETNKHTAKKVGQEDLPIVMMTKRIGRATVKPSVTKDKKSIYSDKYYDHKDAYYNGKWHDAMYLVYDIYSRDVNCFHTLAKVPGIAMVWADPYWFLITTSSGIEYGGRTYEARKLLRSWKPSDSVNMTLYSYKSRKRSLPNPNVDKFDKIAYDIVETASDSKMVVTREVNGNAERFIEFYPADAPVTYDNLEFRVSGNKWTIYSKCGYIKFNGRTYKKGQSILSFGTAEDVHIEIVDQSNVYEIEERLTYTIKSCEVLSKSYEIHTAEGDKTIKVVKTSNGKEEPWETVRFYDAMYENCIVDDVKFDFDNVGMTWALISNNDKLYYGGQNFKQNETIQEWSYNTINKITGISVSTMDDTGVEVKLVSSKSQKKNQDLDVYVPDDIEEADADFKVVHSASRGSWIVKSNNDEMWSGGINYRSGDVLLTFKDKVIVDPIGVMVTKIDEETEEPYNVLYQVYSTVDPLNDLTTLYISQTHGNLYSYNNKDTDPKDVQMIVTKEKMKSLYGYIWKRDRGPGPTPPSKDYVWDVIPIDIRNDGNGYRYICMVNTTFGSRTAKRADDTLNSQYNRIRVDDKFYSDSLGLVSLSYQEGTTDGQYKYYAGISNSKMRWTYRSSDLMRDFSTANLPYVKCRVSSYIEFQVRYAYTDPGVHIFTKVVWDQYMAQRTMTSRNVTIESNETYLYSLKYYEIDDPIVLLFRVNYPIIQYTNTEETIAIAEWVNIDELTIVRHIYSRWRDKEAVVQVIYSRAVQYIPTVRIYDIRQNFTTWSYTIGTHIFFISGWGITEYREGGVVHYSYNIVDVYDYKTDEFVEQTIIEATDINGTPIFEFYNYTVFEGKYIYAYKPVYVDNSYEYNDIEIYQANINDYESILNPTLVNTISKDQQINCFIIPDGVYETLTAYDIIFYKHSSAWEGYVFCETILYDDRTYKIGKNKTGFFRPLLKEYAGNGIYNDKLIVYIPDPSFQSLNNVFGFMASSLRYSSQISEPQPNPELHN